MMANHSGQLLIRCLTSVEHSETPMDGPLEITVVSTPKPPLYQERLRSVKMWQQPAYSKNLGATPFD